MPQEFLRDVTPVLGMLQAVDSATGLCCLCRLPATRQ